MPLNFYSFVKRISPTPIRRVIRKLLNYYNRVAIWPIILWQVRGVTWKDQFALYISAATSPYFAMFNLMEWQDPVLIADADVRIENIGIFNVRKKSDDLYHVTPWREKAIFAKVNQILKPGDVFLDAGANIGVYTILASRLVGIGGRVIAVEMIPDTADQLELNVRINGLTNVTVVRKALSEYSGQELIAMVEPGRFGRASVSVDRPESTKVSVLTATLDEIAKDIQSVRLMKMDIEGAEYSALLGGKSLMDRLDNIIYEQWHGCEITNDPVASYLIRNSFRLLMLDGSNYLAHKELQTLAQASLEIP